MLKWFNKKKKDNKGFTLVELVIVVAILAILVGVLAPQYTKYVEKSRKAADASNLENLVTAFKVAATDGTDVIEAGNYGISIGVDVKDTVAGEATEDTAASGVTITSGDNVIALLNGFAGDGWTKTKLKSSKWTAEEGKGDALDKIMAVCKVDNDGSVVVSYYPTWIKELVK